MKIFYAVSSVAIVAELILILCMVMVFNSEFPADVDRFFRVVIRICLIVATITIFFSLFMYLYGVILNFDRLESSKKEEKQQTQTLENKSIILSPLYGIACQHEDEIVEELQRRGKRDDGTLNRAAVAQLLRALQDKRLLKTHTAERDELMKWVSQVTGYAENNVSAFNEALNNATVKKVEEAKAWLDEVFSQNN